MNKYGMNCAALLLPHQMDEADRLTADSGVSEIELMGEAGRQVVREIIKHYPRSPVSILCGPGNNGGDGFVIGTLLRSKGWPVRLAQFGDKSNYSLAAQHYLNSWGETEGYSEGLLNDALIIVDALFGSGLDRTLQGSYQDIVLFANQTKASMVAVDTPSGVHGGTGQVLGAAIKAERTVTFFRRKPGHLMLPGREMCGQLACKQIGIRSSVLEQISPQQFRNGPELWSLPSKEIKNHKYSSGHCLVISGPKLKTGAARMSAIAALRSGAGLVSICGESSALDEHASQLTAIMLREEPLEDLLNDKRFNSIIVGPGNGRNAQTRHNVLIAVSSGQGVILDADALSSFADDPSELFDALQKSGNSNIVLTPHAGEFKRLFGMDDLNESKLEKARAAAKLSGAVVVYKGSDTVIAKPDGTCVINDSAPANLATAGTGDVLAGIVAGLVAQGMQAFDAACAGVYVHGLAGREFRDQGMIATDLPQMLPIVFSKLKSKINANLNP